MERKEPKIETIEYGPSFSENEQIRYFATEGKEGKLPEKYVKRFPNEVVSLLSVTDGKMTTIMAVGRPLRANGIISPDPARICGLTVQIFEPVLRLTVMKFVIIIDNGACKIFDAGQ